MRVSQLAIAIAGVHIGAATLLPGTSPLNHSRYPIKLWAELH